MTIAVHYGDLDNKVDVTEKVFFDLDYVVHIPSDDISRCLLFCCDPLYGALKSVYVTINSTTTVFDSTEDVYIDTKHEKIYTNLGIPRELLKKAMKITRNLNVKYGHVEDEITTKIVSNKFSEENGSVIISYCLKNNEPLSDVSTDEFNYPLQSHKSEFIPAEIFQGYKEIDVESWKGLNDKTSCPYILVNTFSVPAKEGTCIIAEISKNAKILLSETNLTPENLQVWIKMKEILNVKVNSPENKLRKRYVLIGNNYILKKY